VWAHIFVAALAFLLDRALEKKLKAAGAKSGDAVNRAVSKTLTLETKSC